MVTIKLQIFWLIDWLAYFSQFVILINFLQLFLIIQGADVCRKSRNCQLAALLVLGRPWRAYRHLFHGTRSPVAGQWVSDTFFKTVLFSLSMARTVDKQKNTTWKLCRGVCVPRSFNFDTRFQSISGVGRACRVGHVPVFVSLPVVI
jgi:fatty-acid desaturase